VESKAKDLLQSFKLTHSHYREKEGLALNRGERHECAFKQAGSGSALGTMEEALRGGTHTFLISADVMRVWGLKSSLHTVQGSANLHAST